MVLCQVFVFLLQPRPMPLSFFNYAALAADIGIIRRREQRITAICLSGIPFYGKRVRYLKRFKRPVLIKHVIGLYFAARVCVSLYFEFFKRQFQKIFEVGQQGYSALNVVWDRHIAILSSFPKVAV